MREVDETSKWTEIEFRGNTPSCVGGGGNPDAHLRN